jgi:hypothetical protein
MKKLSFGIVLLAAGLILSSSAFGQKKNAIKINLFSPIIKTGTIFYERALSDAVSAELGFSYTGWSSGDTKWRGFGIQPDFRFYPSKNEDLKGFYIAPFARYFSMTGTNDPLNAEGTLNIVGGGLLIGGQFLIGEWFTLDIFAGPQYLSFSVKEETGSSDDLKTPSLEGFLVRGGLTLGFAF